MNRSEAKKFQLRIGTLVLILGVLATLSADAFSVPVKRTTSEQWSFSTPDKENVHPDNGYIKPPDTYDPCLYVNTTYQYDGEAGAWPLGELDIFIPNFSNTGPGTFKQIQIQLTWQGASNNYMPPQPLVGVVPDYSSDNPPQYITTILPRQDFSPVNGWNRSLFLINIEPNPFEEWIAIKGDIIVDQVVINTECIPEPATLALITGGASWHLDVDERIENLAGKTGCVECVTKWTDID